MPSAAAAYMSSDAARSYAGMTTAALFAQLLTPLAPATGSKAIAARASTVSSAEGYDCATRVR
eukprot:1332978-Pleurochrysis_carterae.AAC.3